MGSVVKKITKPISKVLDKIVPNEIKPLLPYAAAFAPYMLPAGFGMGASTGLMGLLKRAALTGGLNIGSQLAQDGSDGEFSKLSALLAGVQGGLTGTNAANTFKTSMSSGNELGFLDKTKNFALKGLAKGAEFGNKASTTLKSPFDAKILDVAKAASVPISQGTGDLAMSQARLALKEFEEGEALRLLQDGADQEGIDSARRIAVLNSMNAYGFVQDEIDETLKQIGLFSKGGRVGRNMGGDFLQMTIENESSEPNFGGITSAVANIKEEENLQAGRSNDLFMLREEAIMKNDSDKIKEIELDFFREFGMPMPTNAAKGGIMGLNMGGSVLPQGMEMDYRGGGFIPMGSKEKADDVPARVSKNEFVMTADAVRAAGGGSVNQGAKRMYNLMNNLEARA